MGVKCSSADIEKIQSVVTKRGKSSKASHLLIDRADLRQPISLPDGSLDASLSRSLAFTELVEEGPHGYNHSKAQCKPLPCDMPSYWKVSEGKCNLSLPVSSLTVVLSMLIISDLQLFLQIFENGPTPNREVRKNPSNWRMNNYATDFQNHCSSGDNRLSTDCQRIISERFDYDNRQLVLSLFDHFTNWRELSMLY
jgi:hypothetical protein